MANYGTFIAQTLSGSPSDITVMTDNLLPDGTVEITVTSISGMHRVCWFPPNVDPTPVDSVSLFEVTYEFSVRTGLPDAQVHAYVTPTTNVSLTNFNEEPGTEYTASYDMTARFGNGYGAPTLGLFMMNAETAVVEIRSIKYDGVEVLIPAVEEPVSTTKKSNAIFALGGM